MLPEFPEDAQRHDLGHNGDHDPHPEQRKHAAGLPQYGGQGLGLSRINFPFMLGTMFTPNRDRAKLIGFGVHFLNGWIFASVYAATFESWRRATWWLGGAIGLVHALYVLVAAMPALPAMHPRMASEQEGPTPTKQLEPPGFLALNYGRRTPITVILAHLLYGAILGAFYRLK